MKVHQIDYSSGSVTSCILRTSIPMILAELVNLLYSMVDRIYIGHIPGEGSVALTGLGLCFPIISLISAFARLFGFNGGAPLCAMARGRGDMEEASKVMGNSFLLAALTGFVLMAIVEIFHEPILYAFGASDITYPYARDYLLIYALGSIPVLLTLSMNAFINSQGFASVGMITVLLGAVLNIILDPVFIFTLGMGVKGAAIATVLSQILSSLIVISFLRSRNTSVRLHMSGFSKRLILPILKYGVSSFIIISTDSILLIILNSVLQRYGGEETGDLLITAATIVQSYHILVTYPMGGMTAGCQGLASYNFGAGLTKRVGKTINNLQIFITAYSVAMFFFTLSGSHLFASLFTSDEEMIALSSRYMFVFECMVIPLSFQYVNVDMMTALGEIRIALPLSLTRKISFLIATVTLPVFLPASSAFLAEGISDLLSGLIGTLIMRKNLPGILQRRAKGDLRI